ncbi:phosphatidylglycerophosphatase A [Haliea sp. AH-315-K21]|uniref:Phosphatidylglycerophosphatase A n=1 Tax=SAR86 cluster bacterium TaxID=2030880 RepID=A0A2A5CJX0_9GAMM|nr:phosphatidylglycerophosphatase A [Haliea sp. AH-315-K21]MBN4075941.1 phosphatidylglycerophosphatase A [Gammaproteobacteria bacterium AH-315-E17]PCJ41805.1 MAG: phosphatidylglycerophosphatase A [SAR86 cluster bacterium]PCJ43818.1 MAG: phosphatidylglycerophosphatase A [SAR86 cluster bacterium]
MPSLKKTVFTHPVHFLAFGFGSGLSPKAPGTAGTVVAVILYLLLAQLPLLAYLGMLLVTFAVGIYICGRSSKLLGVHDHGGIVWDEFVGYWITMLVAPSGWEWIIIGFILFRLFDILKPFPINVFDKHVHGGLGIMLDDAIAGSFAWLCLQLIAIGVAA